MAARGEGGISFPQLTTIATYSCVLTYFGLSHIEVWMPLEEFTSPQCTLCAAKNRESQFGKDERGKFQYRLGGDARLAALSNISDKVSHRSSDLKPVQDEHRGINFKLTLLWSAVAQEHLRGTMMVLVQLPPDIATPSGNVTTSGAFSVLQ